MSASKQSPNIGLLKLGVVYVFIDTLQGSGSMGATFIKTEGQMGQKKTEEQIAHPHILKGEITHVSEDKEGFAVLAGTPRMGIYIPKSVCKIVKMGQIILVYLHNGSYIQGIDLDDNTLFFQSRNVLH